MESLASSWHEESSWYTDLLAACRRALALPPDQWQFKSDYQFTAYLEHMSGPQGQQVLAAIPQEFPDIQAAVFERLPSIAAENDALGKPWQFDFRDLKCSPANLQYVWHTLLFLRHLRNNDVHNTNVIELGAGYGGMALYVHRLADLFSVTIQSYTTVDLAEMAELQSRYCEQLGVPITGIDGSDAAALEACLQRPGTKSLFSSYAFAEFDVPTQNWYAEKLVSKCDHGFLVWNTYVGWTHRGPNPVYKFMETPVTVVSDPIPFYPGWDMQDVSW